MQKERTKLIKHPSYGYCTQEDWDRVQTLGIGPERDRLLKKIKDQQGKPKKKKP